MRPAPRGRRRRRDERGGIAVFVAVTTTLLLLVSALAVDLGQQRVGRRDMQALADVVALDMARLLQGRTTAQVLADPAWSQELARSVARNPETLGEPPQVTAVPGRLAPTTGVFTATTGTQVPNAVRVTASTSVAFSIMPGEGGATRTAVAASDPTACFSLGSFAAGLSTGSSPLLNALVGDALNLTAVSYDGLADARVSLLGIATELGAGTVDELVALPGLTLNRFFVAAANVLQREGGQTADVQLLRTLSTSVGALPSIRVTDLLQLSPGADAALGASLNVLDLVSTAAFVSNGSNFLAVPNLSADLGVTGLSTGLRIIQRPQTGCGRPGEATAMTSQVALTLDADLVNLPNILGTTASASVELDLDVAEALGRLTATTCGAVNAPSAASPDRLSVAVQDGLVNLRLRVPVTLRLLDIPVLRVDVLLGTAPPAAAQTANLVLGSTAAYGTPVTTGAGNIGLTGLSVDASQVEVLGSLGLGVGAGALVGGVVSLIVNPLVQALDQALLTPLLDLLGVQLSGADVYGVPRPDCSTPALRG